MSILPLEIVQEILSICLASEKSGSVLNLLTTSSLFLDICQQVLYTYLRFTSRAQLALFTSIYGPRRALPYIPRSIEFDITSSTKSHSIFSDIYAMFSQCLSDLGLLSTERDECGRLCLDSLRLRFNSHYSDSEIEMVYTALSLVNPRDFIWTGPDPPHHFSVAIIPRARVHLFRALSEYTNLVYLKLTHISLFPSVDQINQFPVVSSLRTFYLGQVIHLEPMSIATLLFNPESKNLEKLYLVDAYLESIWGPRVRRSDVEMAAAALRPRSDNVLPQELDEDVRDRIRQTIICVAQTERIIGGDRVEDNKLLV